MKTFRAGATFTNKTGQSMYSGGWFEREAPPTQTQFRAMYQKDAKKKLAERGFPIGRLKMTSFRVVELPPVPKPPANEKRPLKHWKVTADIVCHDLKLACVLQGVFAWPEEPTGLPLAEMAYFLIAEDLARRGDSPTFADYTDINSRKVEPTDEPAINL